MNALNFFWVSIALLGGAALHAAAAPLPPLQTAELAERVLHKGLAEIDLGLYPGTLLLQGMSELASHRADDALLKRTVALYKKFTTQEIKGRGSFISYEVGGSGAAFLRQRGLTSELDGQVAEAAKRMVEKQARSGEGLLVPSWVVAEKDQIFIDIAFAVTPYLLYAGLAEKNATYIDLAIFETLELFRILRDSKTGLLRQGRGFQVKGGISEDNWSRGNGWGAVGLAALVRDLPAAHPKRAEVEALARDFYAAVLRHQNPVGLWHQEMSDPFSYTETSGSGLLLYGLGVMLERGVVDQKHRADLVRGLAALPAYIAADGSVGHACIGCLCPGQGIKADYKTRPWAQNDAHAFGPIVLAYAQAVKLGIREITPTLKPGCLADPEDSPEPPRVTAFYNPEGGQNVGWENDRIAFRVYGPSVRDRVGSGIDIWAKSVEFPIIKKWYRLNAAGHEYHIDRGEGCDFYEVGKLRGCGGSALWRHGRPFPSQTYATHRIITNNPDEVEFVLTFDAWDADGIKVWETKTVRMVAGTNFFQVTSTLHTANPAELTLAVGLTTFGQPSLTTDKNRGVITSWEKINPAHGTLGTVVVGDPARVTGFGQSGSDRFVLLSVKSNEPVTYYVGAGWDGNRRFQTSTDWADFIRTEADWSRLAGIYAHKPATPR